MPAATWPSTTGRTSRANSQAWITRQARDLALARSSLRTGGCVSARQDLSGRRLAVIRVSRNFFFLLLGQICITNHAVAAMVLGGIQRGIGKLNQVALELGVGVINRNPNA